MEHLDNLVYNKQYKECVHYLLNNTKCFNLIKHFAELAIETSSEILDYIFWDDYAVALYYLNDKKGALKCYQRILGYFQTSLNESQINHLISNIDHSIDNKIRMTDKIDQTIGELLNCQPILINLTEELLPYIKTNYHPTNPSIIINGNQYLINVRAVNYQFSSDYKYIGSDNINTINYLIDMNYNLELSNCRELKYNQMPYHNSRHQGWEDIRLFNYNNNIYGSFTTLGATPCLSQHICISQLNVNNADKLTGYILLDGYGKNKLQKNWTPLISNDKLFFIYSFFPLIILEYKDNNVKPYQVSLPNLFNNWRGGSPAITLKEIGFPNYYLCIVHESYFPSYYHRFILLEQQECCFKIINFTPTFYFINNQIEFCAGLTLSLDHQDLLITFGKLDNFSYLSKISIKPVLNQLLNPIIKLTRPVLIETSPYTVVSAFFNLYQYESNRIRNLELYLEKSKKILTIPNIKLVLFTDDQLIVNLVKNISPYIRVIYCQLSDFPYYCYIDNIKKIRDVSEYNGFNINKDTPLYTITGWSKISCLKKAIELNYYQTEYFIWIDFGIYYIKDHQYLDQVLRFPSYKIRALCINIPDKKLENYHNLNLWLCYLAGGLFGGHVDNVLKLIELFDCNVKLLISNNIAPLEDGILSRIAFLNPDLFEYYYGDYSDIIDNYIELTNLNNIELIKKNLIISRQQGNYNLSQNIFSYVMSSHYQDKITLNPEDFNFFWDNC